MTAAASVDEMTMQMGGYERTSAGAYFVQGAVAAQWEWEAAGILADPRLTRVGLAATVGALAGHSLLPQPLPASIHF